MPAKVTSALPITARAIETFWFQQLIFASGVPPLLTFPPQLDFPGPACARSRCTVGRNAKKVVRSGILKLSVRSRTNYQMLMRKAWILRDTNLFDNILHGRALAERHT